MVSKSRRRREARERAAAGVVVRGGSRGRGGRRCPPPVVVRGRGRARIRPRANMSVLSGQSNMVQGVDVIGVTQIEAKDQVGSVLLQFVVNPRLIVDTRLGRYSQLWARWRPVQLRLECATAAGMMVPGSYTVGWNADPSDRVPSRGTAVQHVSSLVCQKSSNIGRSVFLDVPCSATQRWYTMRGDPADDSHGVLLAVLSGKVGVSAVSIIWKLHWKFLFNGPDNPVQVDDEFVEPESDYAGIFTDSVSDWAGGKKLTFKHATGGSVVPWEGIRSGVVYTVTAGVKIPYYNQNGTSVEAKWFSRINDAAYPSGLAVHDSQASAQAYQETSDISKVLDYYKAGDWATPNLPRLKAAVSSVVGEGAVSILPRSEDAELKLEVQQLRKQLQDLLITLPPDPGPSRASSMSFLVESAPRPPSDPTGQKNQ